jgi:hypothetical protein
MIRCSLRSLGRAALVMGLTLLSPLAFMPAPAWGQNGLDAFFCYDVKAKGFDEVEDVHVVDQFNDLRYDVTETRELCTPAAAVCGADGIQTLVNGISDPLTHLRRYKIERDDDEEAEVLPANLSVTTCLGTVEIDTYSGDKLMVPASKALRDAPEAPDPQNHQVDHFHCYDAQLSNDAELPDDLQVTLEDQFVGPKTFDVKDVEHFCVAADKNGEGIKHKSAALLCYKVKAAKKKPKFSKVKKVWSTDQFGELRQDVISEDEVCLPATFGPCAFPGAPAWQNVVRPGGQGAITQDTTPQDCCSSCVADPNCAQWAFFGSGPCQHNVGANVCVASPTPSVDSGMVRCP